MRWSYLALIPVLAMTMFACNPSKKNKNAQPAPETETVIETKAGETPVEYSEIEVKPSFNGGDANTFALWVNSHLTYPEQALKDRIQGRVVVQFTIGADGVIRDIQVLRSVREDLDAETVRVISSSPKWEPGKQNGEPVPVFYTIPVVYKLR